MTATKKPGLFDQLRKLASEVHGQPIKSAQEDPGGISGASSHPTADGDNGTQAATEGARSSENEKDIKEQEGAAGVDSVAAAVPGTQQDSVMPNVGVTQKATGEDPSVEDNYKDKKEDPGTSHPASADVGEKYAKMNLREKIAAFNKLANTALAEVAVGLVSGQPAAKPQAAPQEKAAATQAPAGDDAFAAGYELAKHVGWTQKQAAEYVQSTVEQTMAHALESADLVGRYVRAFAKQAAYDAEGGGEDGADAKDTAGADIPPGADAGAGDGAPMGGAPAGGGGDEAALTEFVAALDEMGITPEELMMALSEGGAPAGGAPAGGDPAAAAGGMPPMDPAAAAGGMPPEAAPPMDPSAMKLASTAKQFKRSGRYQFKAANTGTNERALRNEFKSVISELLGR